MNGEEAFKRGKEFYEQGEYSKAIVCLDKALDDDNFGARGAAWNNKGVVYEKFGEYDKAIKCYKTAIDGEKYDTPGIAWNNMGVAYGNLGDPEKAIECFKKAFKDKNYATPGDAWNNMGFTYYDLKKYDKAIECYKKAIRCDPKHAVVYNNLGEALYKLKRSVDAEEQFRKAIQINFDLPEPHYNLGIILTNEEYYEDAKKEYEIAVKLEPTNADYLNSLGYILVELGQHEKAKENFENAICFDPTHSKAHHNLRELKKISETKYSSLKYLLVKLRKYIEKATSYETKYRMQSLFRYGFILLIIYMIYDTRKLLNLDKLSGTEFVALIVFLISLLTVMILFPKFKYIKASLSGFECLVDTEGKMMEPKPVMGGITNEVTEIVNDLKAAPPTKHQEAP